MVQTMQTILGEFLVAGLLPIGEDDEKLALLEGAAADLAQQINAIPLLSQRFALVSLDDDTLSTDSTYAAAGAAVTSRWATITNKVGPNPTQVYRAVLLRGLEIAALDNIPLQLAIVLTARNLPIRPASRTTHAVALMLSRFSEAIQPDLTRTWISTPGIQFPKAPGRTKKAPVGRDDLLLALSRASGPTDKAGKALANPNPHWTNAGQPWSAEFAERATDGIVTAIDAALRVQSEEVQAAVRDTLHTLTEELEKLTIRDAKSELLWIRTSGYSPSARRAFGGMSNAELVTHAVLDVARTVKALAPPSIEYFLRDLVATHATQEPTLVHDFLSEFGRLLAGEPEGRQLAAASAKLPPNGRRPWLEIALKSNASIAFEAQAGVPATHVEVPAELAVKLYREVQVAKLVGAL